MRSTLFTIFLFAFFTSAARGDEVEVTGELRQWHKITLTATGPAHAETDSEVNPFLDYRLTAVFSHEESGSSFTVPGYFAADGEAGETGGASGDQWRAHFAADHPGEWTYQLTLLSGPNLAIASPGSGAEGAKVVFDHAGKFSVSQSDKAGRDFRASGRLSYVGERYLRFEGSGELFLKAGADAPETLLAFTDFDATSTRKPSKGPLKSWEPHLSDWEEGDPTWRGGKGKGRPDDTKTIRTYTALRAAVECVCVCVCVWCVC
ncbi:MAG: DUF5060 domain-containing protein, partial [Verrucomicrobiota bacterium]